MTGTTLARTSHLKRRGATYYARMRVPLDLVDYYGRSELVKALGTTDQGEAKRLLLGVLDGWHREFEEARRRRDLSPQDLERAVWERYTTGVEADESFRATVPTADDLSGMREQLAHSLAAEGVDTRDHLAFLDATVEYQVAQNAVRIRGKFSERRLAELQDHLTRQEYALVADQVDHFITENQLDAKPGTPAWIALARAMMRAEIEVVKRSLERDKGDYTGTPADPIVKPATSPITRLAKPGETIMEIFDAFATENPRSVKQDRLQQTRRDVECFVQSVGHRFPIALITKVEVRNWKQLLLKYPVKATETNVFAGMDIAQIVAANEKHGKPTISDRTVNRYLSSLSAFLDWCEHNGYIERNPVTGLTLKNEKHAKTLPFTSEQLNTLFQSPLFAGCQDAEQWRKVAKPGNIQIRDHRFWVPLILLFTGARPGEIGQLAVSDVRQQHERWIIHITTEGDATDEGKSVKTAGSMRVLPIHPQLIKLGFLDYHAQRVKEGGAALFPGAVRNSRGQMLADFSREFGRYLQRIGLKEGRGLSLYSFRHGVTDALRRAGYLDREFGFILGHTEASTTGRYGILPQGMLDQRAALINAIEYPNLSLDHLIKVT